MQRAIARCEDIIKYLAVIEPFVSKNSITDRYNASKVMSWPTSSAPAPVNAVSLAE